MTPLVYGQLMYVTIKAADLANLEIDFDASGATVSSVDIEPNGQSYLMEPRGRRIIYCGDQFQQSQSAKGRCEEAVIGYQGGYLSSQAAARQQS